MKMRTRACRRGRAGGGAEETPGVVDGDGHDGRVRRRRHQGQRALRPEGREDAAARAGALREDHRGDAAARDLLLSEPADGLHRFRAIAAIDERVSAAAEVVGDAGDPPPRQLPLGHELQVVAREHRPQDRDVEHALVIRHEDRRPSRLQPALPLHVEARPAETQAGDERLLEPVHDDLVRPPSERSRRALEEIEDEEDEAEGEQERHRCTASRERAATRARLLYPGHVP